MLFSICNSISQMDLPDDPYTQPLGDLLIISVGIKTKNLPTTSQEWHSFPLGLGRVMLLEDLERVQGDED